jgi:hypothetical protein
MYSSRKIIEVSRRDLQYLMSYMSYVSDQAYRHMLDVRKTYAIYHCCLMRSALFIEMFIKMGNKLTQTGHDRDAFAQKYILHLLSYSSIQVINFVNLSWYVVVVVMSTCS